MFQYSRFTILTLYMSFQHCNAILFDNFDTTELMRFSRLPVSKFDNVHNIVLDDDMKRRLQKYIYSFKDCSHAGAFSLAILQLDGDDKVLSAYSQGYGNVDPSDSSSARANPDTRFCVGSVTEQFTALALGKLLKDNQYPKLYDTPVSSILGHANGRIGLDVFETNLLTVRDLLAHRTGFPTFSGAPSILPAKSRESVWGKLYNIASSGTSAKFRSSMKYSNLMYSRCGLAIEAMNNFEKTWEQVLQKYFFDPLGMANTTFFTYPHNFTSFALPAFMNIAGQFQPLSNPTLWSYFLQYSKVLEVIGPAEGICTTANDMIQYMTYILRDNDTDTRTPTRDIIVATQADSNNVRDGYDLYQSPDNPTESVSPTYGMGWLKGYYRGYKWIGHSGTIIGYTSQLMFFPGLRIGIFLSSTSGIVNNRVPLRSMAHGILDILMKKSTWIDANFACPKLQYFPKDIQKDALPDLNNCTLPNAAPFNKMTGIYTNRIWGDAQVTVHELGDNRIRVEFKVGSAAYGCLSHSPNVDSNMTMRIRFNPQTYLSIMNKPHLSIKQNNKIEFWSLNGDEIPQALTYYFLDSSINQRVPANSFYKAEFNACLSNPCSNSGTCTLDLDFNDAYVCLCLQGFTGLHCEFPPIRDCSDLCRYHNVHVDGIYEIHPDSGPRFSVFCQFESNNAWTILQRRTNGSTVSFTGNWNKYLHTFGRLNSSHWLGLENIFNLANQKYPRTLQVDLCDCQGVCTYQQYNNFWISDESDKYRMHIETGTTKGTAGSGLTFGWIFTTDNMQFTTIDNDNDMAVGLNCAEAYKGGWWYNQCYAANLNGVYYENCAYPSKISARDGIEWIPWKMKPYPLYSVLIKIK